jgi:hypothetical protein
MKLSLSSDRIVVTVSESKPEHNAEWRLARDGDWREYTGSAFQAGRRADPELARLLSAFIEVSQ